MSFPHAGRLETNDEGAVFTKGYPEPVDGDRIMDDFTAYCGMVKASQYVGHVTDAIVYQADNGVTGVRVEATIS